MVFFIFHLSHQRKKYSRIWMTSSLSIIYWKLKFSYHWVAMSSNEKQWIAISSNKVQ
jgi:hypothetical protein